MQDAKAPEVNAVLDPWEKDHQALAGCWQIYRDLWEEAERSGADDDLASFANVLEEKLIPILRRDLHDRTMEVGKWARSVGKCDSPCDQLGLTLSELNAGAGVMGKAPWGSETVLPSQEQDLGGHLRRVRALVHGLRSVVHTGGDEAPEGSVDHEDVVVKAILDYLKGKGARRTSDIIQHCGKGTRKRTIEKRLKVLVAAGILRKPRRGQYALATQ